MNRAVLALGLVLAAMPVRAETLRVGPDERFKLPSEALKAATDGDTVEIVAGEYFDCSRVNADNLTIVGLGAGATFSDATCDGKAELVVRSNDVTIRNVNFIRARVPDGNGAGIRAEGRNLTIEKARFVNNQVGILAASSPHSVITIKNAVFDDNGACRPDGHCVDTLMVGDIARLHVEKSTLTGARGGMLITSSARRTELVGNTLNDGAKGHAGGLVQAAIGALVMEENILAKTTPYTNRRAAVFVLPSGAPLGELTLTRNQYTNNTGVASALLIDYSGAGVALTGNSISPGDDEISTDGIYRYQAGKAYHATKDAAIEAMHAAKRGIKILLGR